MEGYCETPRVKCGPALGDYGAVAMNIALIVTMTPLPGKVRKTLTWYCGKELSAHAQFTLESGMKVYFADPLSHWQRPTNESTNGLLCQYFPKCIDLSRWSAEHLEAVAVGLNNGPRKTLGWKTPAEVLPEQIRSRQQSGVRTTD
jgi:IS30 family transposase